MESQRANEHRTGHSTEMHSREHITCMEDDGRKLIRADYNAEEILNVVPSLSENIQHLYYKDQLVNVYRNNSCFLREPNKSHK
jgi:hypothetical protein